MFSKVKVLTVSVLVIAAILTVVSLCQISDSISGVKGESCLAEAKSDSNVVKYYLSPASVTEILQSDSKLPIEIVLPVLAKEAEAAIEFTEESTNTVAEAENQADEEVQDNTEGSSEGADEKEEIAEATEADESTEIEEATEAATEKEDVFEEASEEYVQEPIEKETVENIDIYESLFVTDDTKLEAYLNVRVTPGGELAGILYPQSVGKIISIEGDYAQIKSGDVTGYVDRSFILEGKAAAEANPTKIRAIVITSLLTLRNKPSEDSIAVDMLSAESVLYVLSAADGWAYVNYNDQFGYVSIDYVDVYFEGNEAVAISDELLYKLAGISETEETVVETVAETVAAPVYETIPEVTVPEIVETSPAIIETAPVVIETAPAVIETEPVYIPEETVAVTEAVPSVSYEETTAPAEVVTEASQIADQTADATVLTPDEIITSRINAYVALGVSGSNPVYLSAAEIYLMACVISLEDGYGDFSGQLAIANVMVNRLKSGIWGGDMYGVLYAQGQFYAPDSPYLLNKMAEGPFESCVEAAIQACAGINNLGDYMFFCTMATASRYNFSSSAIIDNIVFYKR